MKPNLESQIYYSNPKLNLVKLIKQLFVRRVLILFITALFTAYGIYYVAQIPDKYETESSFSPTINENYLAVNKILFPTGFHNEISQQGMFDKFIQLLTSKKFQEKVFIEGNYEKFFNINNTQIDDLKTYVVSKIKSIKLIRPSKNLRTEELFSDKPPYKIYMVGNNSEGIIQYINDLVNTANIETISFINQEIEFNLNYLLDELLNDKEVLLLKAQKNRKNEIIRLEDEKKRKMQDINLQIASERLAGKLKRLNEIQLLKDSAELASTLLNFIITLSVSESPKGIAANNFSTIIATDEQLDFLSKIPNWYQLDKKSLLEKISLVERALRDKIVLLESVTNEDLYLPELVPLKKQLLITETANANAVEILKARTKTEDTAFLREILEIDFSIKKLEAISLDSIKTESSIYLVSSSNIANKIKPDVIFIVMLFTSAGLLLSILLSLVLDAFKRESELKTQ
jgi:LPS O-antigen subunit length determinant protein (WzzB/FepE family)